MQRVPFIFIEQAETGTVKRSRNLGRREHKRVLQNMTYWKHNLIQIISTERGSKVRKNRKHRKRITVRADRS